uniref:Uncharacterized protein n=1 Tax=viral metagenome TaxID=1070528 RepID=A0A6M3L8H2_9ZZZZ
MEELNNNEMSIVLSIKNDKGILKQWGKKITDLYNPIELKAILSSWGRTLQWDEVQNEMVEHIKE